MQPENFVLGNGLNVLLDHVPTVDSCSIGVWVRVGTRDEPKGGSGVAHFVEHTSFRHTPRRTQTRISQDFENVGAYVNAYTTKEETCYYVRTLAEHANIVVDTLADVVLNPLFRDEDVAKERSIITEEIRSYEDEAEEYIFDQAEMQLFKGHPLAYPIVGTAQSVQRITADEVRSFHESNYHASNIIVAVSGKPLGKNFLSRLERSFDSLAEGRPRKRRTTPRELAPSNITIHRPVQQAHMVWQVRTPGYRHDDRFAMQVLNVVLGDGMSSRLNVRLRESKGLAYSVYSQLQHFADCGSLTIYAGVDVSRMTKVDALVRNVLVELMTNGISQQELRRAQMQLKASKLMSLESLTARMTMLGKGTLEQGAPEDPYDTIRRIELVTNGDIARVANEYCNASLWSTYTIVPDGEAG